MALAVSFTDRPEVVLDAAGSWLSSRPVPHNLILSLLAHRHAYPVPGRYWIVADGAGPLGVVLQSPHHFPVALTPMPDDAVVAVVSAIADAGVALPGVSGEAATAARFAAQWAERTLTAAEPFNGQRIYELEGAPSPRRVGGCLRLAEAPDCGLILDWMRSFYADIGEQNISDAEVVVSRRVAAGNFWLWQDDGPCSVAAHTDAAAGVVRIQAVYTPPPLRGHGYAGACVSALSAQLQDAGHRCILYADLANPVSNRLYRGLGYRAAVECLRYRFG